MLAVLITSVGGQKSETEDVKTMIINKTIEIGEFMRVSQPAKFQLELSKFLYDCVFQYLNKFSSKSFSLTFLLLNSH